MFHITHKLNDGLKDTVAVPQAKYKPLPAILKVPNFP